MIDENQTHATTVRVDMTTYKKLRHELVDRGLSFNALVNELIDKHVATNNEQSEKKTK